MGLSGERAQHPLGVLGIVGLAEHSAVHVHHGVAADDHSIRVLYCHYKALDNGQLLYQLYQRRGTVGAGVGAVTALSSKSLTQTVKSVVYRESSSRLRGLPEAKIK